MVTLAAQRDDSTPATAPGAGRVVARIGPMLGLLPETTNAAAIAQSLAIPLVPGRPAGVASPQLRDVALAAGSAGAGAAGGAGTTGAAPAPTSGCCW